MQTRTISATSKVSHHETAAQRLSIHPLIAPNERWRTAGMARQSRPTSTQREDAQVDEWQQRAATSETFPLVKMNTSL